MSATFTWSVISMLSYPQSEGQTDVVFQVNWRCQATQTEGEKTYGDVTTGIKNLKAPVDDFTPYDQLTEEQVIGWVWGSVDQAAVEAKLQQNIDNQISPPMVELALPWSPASAPAEEA